MRIIAGKFKGRRITFPKHIRPTQDKVRQSIFDVLAPVIKGSRVLDLFAGSGALGLEALSRGASCAVFIEKDKRCGLIIQHNLEKLGAEEETKNYCQDVFKALVILKKRKEVFDLVFLDPPYHKDLAKKALKTLSHSGILAPRSFIIAEHAKRDILPEKIEGLVRFKEAKYGETVVSFYTHKL